MTLNLVQAWDSNLLILTVTISGPKNGTSILTNSEYFHEELARERGVFFLPYVVRDECIESRVHNDGRKCDTVTAAKQTQHTMYSVSQQGQGCGGERDGEKDG